MIPIQSLGLVSWGQIWPNIRDCCLNSQLKSAHFHANRFYSDKCSLFRMNTCLLLCTQSTLWYHSCLMFGCMMNWQVQPPQTSPNTLTVPEFQLKIYSDFLLWSYLFWVNHFCALSLFACNLPGCDPLLDAGGRLTDPWIWCLGSESSGRSSPAPAPGLVWMWPLFVSFSLVCLWQKHHHRHQHI